MSLTLELPPDFEAALRQHAERNGVEPEALIEQAVREHLHPVSAPSKLDHGDWVRRTREWAESHRHWPNLPQEAYERESFYEDRW